jgi:hypothetical protein
VAFFLVVNREVVELPRDDFVSVLEERPDWPAAVWCLGFFVIAAEFLLIKYSFCNFLVLSKPLRTSATHFFIGIELALWGVGAYFVIFFSFLLPPRTFSFLFFCDLVFSVAVCVSCVTLLGERRSASEGPKSTWMASSLFC